MKIFYHNDMDGIVSAHIIYNNVKKLHNVNSEDFIEMDYKKTFPLHKIKEKEIVYIVDYSIEPETMKKLLEITPKVIWIDHHQSAIDKYSNFENIDKIAGIRANGLAGCVLTYWYFYGRQIETEEFIKDYPKNIHSRYREEIPEYIRLAGDWDVWEHLYGQSTADFSVCFNTRIKSPMDEKFNFLVDTRHLLLFLDSGEDMIEYRESWADNFMKRYGFETEIDGYRAYVANLGNGNSTYFGDLINYYDIVGTFCYDGDSYNCSLYSTKENVNCAEICAKRGGGGHKGAAGFICKELPFKKKGE